MNKLILIPLFIFLSCGKSPLFNHTKESDKQNRISTRRDPTAIYPALSLEIQWLKGPRFYDESSLILFIKDSKGELIDFSDEFEFQIWMPTMGHGSSPVKIQKLSQGIYKIIDIYFIMPGYWELQIKQSKESQYRILSAIDL